MKVHEESLISSDALPNRGTLFSSFSSAHFFDVLHRLFESGQHWFWRSLQSMLRVSVGIVQCYYSCTAPLLSTRVVSILVSGAFLGPLSDTVDSYNRTLCIGMKGLLPYKTGLLQATFLLGTGPDLS